MEEWEREIHAEKLRALKRTAQLANVSLTPEVLELLPSMRRETVPIHGYRSHLACVRACVRACLSVCLSVSLSLSLSLSL